MKPLAQEETGAMDVDTDIAQARALILGIGNLLWADEGFGVRAVDELHRHYAFGENVRVMDGGTQGIYLVQHIREADILVVFDAVDYGLEPGTLKLVGEGKWSPADFRAALDAADRTRCGAMAPASGLFLTGVDYP